MTEAIITGILALVGTLVGTLGGIIVSSKLTNYRLEKLEKTVEKSVDKHNNLNERVFICEGNIKELQHEVVEIKGVLHNG